MAGNSPDISLADLEAFDPQARDPVGDWRRFLCLFCGTDKPRDNTHRSLCFQIHTGRWTCKRCDQGGYVREFREKRQREEGRTPRPPARRRTAPAPIPPPPNPEKLTELQAALQQGRGLQRLAGTPGEAYLAGRGIPLEVAQAAGVMYHATWFGKPAVVFPIRNPAGELVAAEGRYLQPGPKDPKTFCKGEKRLGAFATVGAWSADLVAVCEGPSDALTLAAAGQPALAAMGKKLPACLAPWMMRKTVLVAADADEPGEAAAEEWAAILRPFGALAERLRPPAKDWNATLTEHGAGAVAAALTRRTVPGLGVSTVTRTDESVTTVTPMETTGPTGLAAPPPAPVVEIEPDSEIARVSEKRRAAETGQPATKAQDCGNVAPGLGETAEVRDFLPPSPFVDEWDAAPLPEPPPEASDDPAPQAKRPDPYRRPARSEWPEDGPADTAEELALARFTQEAWEPHRPLWAEEPVNVHQAESSPTTAPSRLPTPEGLPGTEDALALPVATATPIPSEGAGLGWEYLRDWVGATYLDSGPGTARFLSLLTDDERSEIRGAWEQAFAEWKAYLNAPEGDSEGLAHAETALALWAQLAEHVGVPLEELGGLVRPAHERYAKQRNAQLFPEGLLEEPAAKGKKRKLPTWDRETQARIQWLETWEPPNEFFALYPYRIIRDPAAFKAQLMGEVALGVNGPRAKYGAFQSDLQQLHWRFTSEGAYPRE